MRAAPEVAVVGGANMDFRAKATAALSPHVSNPGSLTLGPGGVARNIAAALSALGVRTALTTRIGADALGEALIAATPGVDLTMTTRSARPTGAYIATLDAAGELAVAVSAMDIVDELLPEVLATHAARLAAAALVVADCNLPAGTLAWLKTLTKHLVIEPVSVAKCVKLKDIGLGGIHAVTPNRLQAEALTGLAIAAPADAMRAAAVLERQGVRHAVISLGRDGAATARRHVPAFAGNAIRDVTGGGDAATAGLILGLLEGRDIDSALVHGQAAAHLTVTGGILSRAALQSLVRCRIPEA